MSPLPRPRAVLIPCVALSSCIWLSIFANYVHLAFLRAVPVPSWVWFVGHGLLVLSVSSFVLTVTTHPGSPPPEWMEAAALGRVESEPDAVDTEVLRPPRARYVRRISSTILYLDHFCYFLGTPIGLRNRKYFILFVVYSSALCSLALALDLYDVRNMFTEPTGKLRTRTPGVRPAVELLKEAQKHESAHELTQDAYLHEKYQNLVERGGHHHDQHAPKKHNDGLISPHTLVNLLNHAIDEYDARIGRSFRRGLVLAVPVNLSLLMYVGGLAWSQLGLAARGRTSLEPYDATYDVGMLHNLRTVFGHRVVLWPLPWPGTHTSADGLRWRRAPGRGVDIEAKGC
jgi:hypothetical protein